MHGCKLFQRWESQHWIQDNNIACDKVSGVCVKICVRLKTINVVLDVFVDQLLFAAHYLHPDLHVALEQVAQELLGVAGEKMDGLYRR